MMTIKFFWLIKKRNYSLIHLHLLGSCNSLIGSIEYILQWMLYVCSFSRVTFMYERKGGRKEREERIVVSSTLFTAAIKYSCHVTCSKKHMLWLMVIGLCNISNLKHGLTV